MTSKIDFDDEDFDREIGYRWYHKLFDWFYSRRLVSAKTVDKMLDTYFEGYIDGVINAVHERLDTVVDLYADLQEAVEAGRKGREWTNQKLLETQDIVKEFNQKAIDHINNIDSRVLAMEFKVRLAVEGPSNTRSWCVFYLPDQQQCRYIEVDAKTLKSMMKEIRINNEKYRRVDVPAVVAMEGYGAHERDQHGEVPTDSRRDMGK